MRKWLALGHQLTTLTVIGCVTWLASVGRLSADAAVAVMLAAAGIGSAAATAERTVNHVNGTSRPGGSGGPGG